MRRRETSFRDYGLSKADVKKVINYCNPAHDIAKLEMIEDSAKEVNPDIWRQLVLSLILNESYETLDARHPMSYNKNDFYGCRRKLIYIIYKKMG